MYATYVVYIKINKWYNYGKYECVPYFKDMKVIINYAA